MKELIKGLITTRRALEWLQQSQKVQILHIFENVCNLVNENNQILSLVTPKIGPGPFSLIINNYHPALFSPDSRISINNKRHLLTIGDVHIDTSNAVVWQARPNWQKLRDWPFTNLPQIQSFSPAIEGALQQLDQGLKTSDYTLCRTGAYHLAGLGNGLTPTGDDILMGALYALWVWFPDEALIRLICDTAVPRTTTLSAAFLRAAATGEATYHWHDFVNGKSNAMQNILNIGHTSGADALAGFMRMGWIVRDLGM